MVSVILCVFFFKQKTAYEMRISDWSSDVCSSDLKGELQKKEYGPWVFTAFKLLAKLRGLRGGALDVFGYTEERKMERQLIADYEKTVGGLLDTLDGVNVDIAAEIAGIPEPIRGYGHATDAHLPTATAREARTPAQWTNSLGNVKAVPAGGAPPQSLI